MCDIVGTVRSGFSQGFHICYQCPDRVPNGGDTRKSSTDGRENVVRTRFSRRFFPPDTLYFFSLLLTVSPWKIKDRKNKRVDTLVTHARVCDSRYGTKGHELKLKKGRYNCQLREFSFSFRVVNTWNNLNPITIQATNMINFKKLLDEDLVNIHYENDLGLDANLT